MSVFTLDGFVREVIWEKSETALVVDIKDDLILKDKGGMFIEEAQDTNEYTDNYVVAVDISYPRSCQKKCFKKIYKYEYEIGIV